MPVEQDVVRAHPHAVRVAVVVIGAITVIGAVTISATRSYLDRLTELARTDRASAIAGFRTWVLPELIVVMAISAGLGLWTLREGRRALGTGRYPRPDMWVLHDTPVRRGRAARTMGVCLVAAGVGLTVVPLLLVLLLLTLLSRAA